MKTDNHNEIRCHAHDRFPCWECGIVPDTPENFERLRQLRPQWFPPATHVTAPSGFTAWIRSLF